MKLRPKFKVLALSYGKSGYYSSREYITRAETRLAEIKNTLSPPEQWSSNRQALQRYLRAETSKREKLGQLHQKRDQELVELNKNVTDVNKLQEI